MPDYANKIHSFIEKPFSSAPVKVWDLDKNLNTDVYKMFCLHSINLDDTGGFTGVEKIEGLSTGF